MLDEDSDRLSRGTSLPQEASTRIVLITRWNLRTKFTKADILGAEWNRKRVDLFETYCAPWAAPQVGGDVDWYVLFDVETGDNLIKTLADKWPIRPVKCRSQSDGTNRVSSQIKGAGRLISVRLDSDDSIAPNFCSSLRQVSCECKVREPLVIFFSDGCEHDTISGQWFDRRYANNPFACYVEDGEAPQLVHHAAHYRLWEMHPTLHVPTASPMWCIRVHESNVANRIKGTPRASTPDHFGPR